jgi:outer membrane immunogenic protein
MHRFVVASLVGAWLSIGFGGAASAADLAPALAPVYTKAPVAAPTSWTGFYAGVSGGYGWGNGGTILSADPGFCNPGIGACTNGSAATATANAVPANFPIDGTGGILGGTLGYNFQINRVVLGIETDFSWAHIEGSDAQTALAPLPIDHAFLFNGSGTSSSSMDTFGTLRARLGYTPVDPLLLYVTGGLAYGQVSSSTSVTETLTGAPPPFPTFNTIVGSASEYRLGSTVGAGGEWRVTPNWSVKAEYLYYDLGTVNYGVGTISGVTPPPCCTAAVSGAADFKGSIVRVGVNYQFR